MADYYRILGVSRDASPEEIKRAFRQLARQHHPDVSGDASGARFREILEAYETLSDETERRAYDARLERARGGAAVERPEWFADEVAIDFPSLARVIDRMRDAFLGADEPVARLSAEIELTVAEARRGTVVPLDVPVNRTCPLCAGRGEIWMDPCPCCRGAGDLLAVHPIEVSIPPGVRHGARFRVTLTPPEARPAIIDLRIAIR